MIKLCGTGVIHPGLGLGGQECSCHNPRCIRNTPTSPLPTPLKLPKCTGINNDPIDLVDNKPPSYDLSSHPLALRYYLFARWTVAFDYASEFLIT